MTDLDKVLARIDAERDNSLDRLFKFLSIKSISTDPAYADECRTAAFSLAADLSTLDIAAEVHPTDGHPVVFAKTMPSESHRRKRVIFYGHYDVQPVDPIDLWQTPPFEPRVDTLPDGRKVIVARGACDDKGQVMTFIEACRAWKAVTGSIPVDITFIIEGEEECGSKHLPGWLMAHKAELAGDIALVCDTGMWDPATPAITSALRGLVYEEVKIKGAGRRKGPSRNRADFFAADLRRKRHLGRLHRPGSQDRDPGRSLRQNLVPSGRQAGSSENPRGIPRLRARAPARRLHRRVQRPHRRAPDRAGLEAASACRSAGRAHPGMGQRGGSDRLRRLDPDRCGFQAAHRHRHAPDRLCAG